LGGAAGGGGMGGHHVAAAARPHYYASAEGAIAQELKERGLLREMQYRGVDPLYDTKEEAEMAAIQSGGDGRIILMFSDCVIPWKCPDAMKCQHLRNMADAAEARRIRREKELTR
jgi:hypothetical protein